MKISELSQALNLPNSAQVELRIPKKSLLMRGVFTPADKRYINDGVEAVCWLAALKPTTIGIPEYRGADREYLEISIIQCILRPGAKTSRIIELIHRAVPYPVLLMIEKERQVNLSIAHKRWAHNEADKIVLDGDVITVEWEIGCKSSNFTEFRSSLALERQPVSNMFVLYQSWLDALIAFKAAHLTGSFNLYNSPELSKERYLALQECARLETEMQRLRAAAGKEKQIARQVEINLKLKNFEAAYNNKLAKL